jgi:hypothetical protein
MNKQPINTQSNAKATQVPKFGYASVENANGYTAEEQSIRKKRNSIRIGKA